MAIPSRPINEILQFNGKFDHVDILIKTLRSLSATVPLPSHIDTQNCIIDSDTTKTQIDKIASVVKSLIEAKGRIRDLGVSLLTADQIQKIKIVAQSLLDQHTSAMQRNAVAVSPFSTRDITMLSFLQDLTQAKSDDVATPLASILKKRTSFLQKMLKEVRKQDGSFIDTIQSNPLLPPFLDELNLDRLEIADAGLFAIKEIAPIDLIHSSWIQR